ncbi:hypothetical protein J5N97_025962 [Dioscorea zingiberensis]|uniref:Uncharacterized protein n=1 Tax=Dioscorea zingiberensis TaxID=325984 RepID=A0A9D5C2J8_9LILI|nr:hypothetical protein J5N97_025962 [Dioscorea zingiberensis]
MPEPMHSQGLMWYTTLGGHCSSASPPWLAMVAVERLVQGSSYSSLTGDGGVCFGTAILVDVSLTIDEFMNGHVCDKSQDLMTNYAISKPHHVETERKLKHWTLDNDDLECRKLEDIFDGTWNKLVENNIL